MSLGESSSTTAAPAVAAAAAAAAAASSSTTTSPSSQMIGIPIQLLRKKTLVPPTSSTLAVHTLTFALPPPDDAVLGGGNTKVIPHHLVRLDLGDVVKMVIPHYKPKSYSMSALRKQEQEFDVTFKVYPNGRASGYLDRLQVGGQEMLSFGMKKNKQYNSGGHHIGIIAYGVGITEGLPVARAELEKSSSPSSDETTTTTATTTPPKTVTLVWASRTFADTFWHEDIQALLQQYPGHDQSNSSSSDNHGKHSNGNQFRMVYMFSRETDDFWDSLPVALSGAQVLRGRLDATVLSTIFDTACHGNNKKHARFLSVGTKDMMAATDVMLRELGFVQPQNDLWIKNNEGKVKDKDKSKKKSKDGATTTTTQTTTARTSTTTAHLE
ncbi:hypothetical protein ACA910_021468 [Epithemia clementina (nom. ined.)]